METENTLGTRINEVIYKLVSARSLTIPLVMTRRGDAGRDGKRPRGWPEYMTSVW